MDKQNILTFIKQFRGEMKKSKFKIWLRAFLLVQFSIIFSVYFFHDIHRGYFTWGRVALVIAAFIPIGFAMSLLVPMKADLESRAVTLSLDRVYLFLIWLLVVAKFIMGHIPFLIPATDFIMCAILGIMFGRLSGIGIRVRKLELQHGFTGK